MWPFSIPLPLGQLHSVFEGRPSVHWISMSPNNGILWPPRLGTLNVHADVNTPECTLGPYKHCKRVNLCCKLTLGEKSFATPGSGTCIKAARYWQHTTAAGHATAKHQDFCGMALCASSVKPCNTAWLWCGSRLHMERSWWQWCRASCPPMLVDILGTNCDQCLSTLQCCFTSTEIIRLIRTESPGRPPRLSHSSWTLERTELLCFYIVRCCSQSQHSPTVSTGLRKGRLCVAIQFRNSDTSWLVAFKTKESFRIHIPMYIASSTITAVMRHGWENKCEVVGHGSFVICDQQPHKQPVIWALSLVGHSGVQGSSGKPHQHWHHDACEVAGSCGVSPMSALAISNAPDLMLKQVSHLPRPAQSWQNQLLKLRVFISCWKCVFISC